MAKNNFQFIFVVGASGSGTTMLSRILSAPAQAVCIGGKYSSIPRQDATAFRVVEEFSTVTAELWDRSAPHKKYLRAKNRLPWLISHLLKMDEYAAVTHVLYKRSTPFYFADRFRPDLQDLLDVFERVKFVVIYRDPIASTFSSIRREFAKNLRQMAVICEERLTYLAAQLAALSPESYRVVSYEAFCEQPVELAGSLAEFCQLPIEDVCRAAKSEGVKPGKNERWREELDTSERQFLSKFFNEQRLAQWQLLSKAALAAV